MIDPRSKNHKAVLSLAAVMALGPSLNVHAAPENPDGARSAGPDIIVGELYREAGEPFPYGLRRWGRVGDITAYTVGVIDCNAGSEPVKVIAMTNEHPVFAFHLYRLKNGRFEQIGLSWLRHEFAALSGSACYADCQGDPDGDTLGVHCSSTNSATVSGTQSNLSPRDQVNSATGVFAYPWVAPVPPATIGRRLQVHDADLHPPSNAGAIYFVEVHEVASDDAQAGNGNNNASYRRLQVVWNGGASTTYNLDFVPGDAAQRESPALLAWSDLDSQVRIEHMDIAGDGRMTLGSRATDLGGGLWHYEYALYNMNSDRSASSFTVPIPPGANVTNLDFHDVDYHSHGENNESFYGGADWPGVAASGSVSWATTPFAENENANAVRWGTTYNFRFDANRPPGDVQADIGLFKPGAPGYVALPATGPVALPALMTRAVSRKSCDLELLPGVTSESRLGGISQVRVMFDGPPGCPASNAVEICETTCGSGEPAPYSGASVVACGVVGNEWVLDFTPALENGRSYRILMGSEVTSVPGQFVDVRGLIADANSDGHVNAADRSAVVGAWTGSGFTCPTDLNANGVTNAADRSVVVGAWTGPENCAPDPTTCSFARGSRS